MYKKNEYQRIYIDEANGVEDGVVDAFRRRLDVAHDHNIDARWYALYAYEHRTIKKSWLCRLLEKFCRWLMYRLDIHEE